MGLLTLWSTRTNLVFVNESPLFSHKLHQVFLVCFSYFSINGFKATKTSWGDSFFWVTVIFVIESTVSVLLYCEKQLLVRWANGPKNIRNLHVHPSPSMVLVSKRTERKTIWTIVLSSTTSSENISSQAWRKGFSRHNWQRKLSDLKTFLNFSLFLLIESYKLLTSQSIWLFLGTDHDSFINCTRRKHSLTLLSLSGHETTDKSQPSSH